ncbi:MAG: extracellular solute-binding protein [Chloroflexi bacterium]|nr:extracellular solute-binding protein [Chloroflexota bacterium]
MRSKSNRFPRRVLLILIVALLVLFSASALLSASQQAPLGIGCVSPSSVENTAAPLPLAAAETAAVFAGANGLTAPGAPPPIEIPAEAFGLPLAQDDTAGRYARSSVRLAPGDSLRFEVTLPAAGEYTLAFDVAVPAESPVPEGQMRVDNAFPVGDLQRIIFPVYFRSSSSVFPKDRYGSDALIPQVRDVRWSTAAARDVNFSEPYALRFTLSAGLHRFDFSLSAGALYLGSIYLNAFAPYPDYADYLAAQSAPETSGFTLTLEAELPTYKNSTSVNPANDRGLTVTPYDTYCQLMNVLGGESWDQSGSAVYYAFSVPQDGLYAITLRALQNVRSNFTVFRRITINGVVPFAQFNTIAFANSNDWTDVTLGGETPYRVFLRQGVNVLSIEATNAPYLTAVRTIQQALLDINDLALEISRLTGNQRDVFREWNISDYIPNIEERLNTIAQNLIADKESLRAIDQSGNSAEILTYQMAIDNLLFLAADPDQIPIYMSRFSQGTGSAAQLLGSLLPLLQNQPLALDSIIIHAPDTLPQMPAVSFITTIIEGIKRFLYSFQPDPYRSLDAGADELEVWVNRPRQYVNLLQLMADTSFTPQTGIRVRFSIMPDEARLVLANAAGIQPDVALGVSTNIPYELAIRNALYDLRSFPDFDSFIRIYSPGALLGYIIDDSVYAIPETQDFWVTYYRQDILDSLALPVPDTWDEVIEILPELQRYGMNYNTPLSSGSGQRGYLFTAPYLFNYGAPLYSDGGFATGLESEEAVAAIRFMADGFTLYGMPLTTANFFDGFRYGTLPIGISNIDTYIKLSTAAPELGGRWGIALYPATVLADGTQNRWTTGSAQTSIMFRNTDLPHEGWQFLRWWMSTATQTEFAEQLILNYGREYLWYSANVEAFGQLDIPQEHRSVILEQWQWVQEPVRLPGSYMQERELSNIWNRIVFDGVNPRVAIDRSVIIINREITRRMEEFGYLVDGQRVRQLRIPTIDTVIGWMQNAGE